ncbi:MAG: helix-turn-helix transcriptional regulator [Bacteroidales bacterium]|nr:helix-turn-helix transcriptional regulator [Bacteroidales bacterium]
METHTPSPDWYSMSDLAIVKELCGILKQVRLQQNITQEQLAVKAGLSRSAISKMETGRSAVELLTVIQVLRALQQLHLLDPWEVKATLSPLLVAKLTAKGRLRASGSTSDHI